MRCWGYTRNAARFLDQQPKTHQYISIVVGWERQATEPELGLRFQVQVWGVVSQYPSRCSGDCKIGEHKDMGTKVIRSRTSKLVGGREMKEKRKGARALNHQQCERSERATLVRSQMWTGRGGSRTLSWGGGHRNFYQESFLRSLGFLMVSQ